MNTVRRANSVRLADSVCRTNSRFSSRLLKLGSLYHHSEQIFVGNLCFRHAATTMPPNIGVYIPPSPLFQHPWLLLRYYHSIEVLKHCFRHSTTSIPPNIKFESNRDFLAWLHKYRHDLAQFHQFFVGYNCKICIVAICRLALSSCTFCRCDCNALCNASSKVVQITYLLNTYKFRSQYTL